MLRGYIVVVSLYKETILPIFSLFTSIGTLLCCALPALLVTLGMGAALAGLVSHIPWLVTMSENKVMVFSVAALLLVGAVILQWRARYQPCPIDELQAIACKRLRKISWWILFFSIIIYLTGFFFAFIAESFL